MRVPRSWLADFIDIPADDDNINILEHAANTAVGTTIDASGVYRLKLTLPKPEMWIAIALSVVERSNKRRRNSEPVLERDEAVAVGLVPQPIEELDEHAIARRPVDPRVQPAGGSGDNGIDGGDDFRRLLLNFLPVLCGHREFFPVDTGNNGFEFLANLAVGIDGSRTVEREHIDQVHQHAGALDVAQELVAQPHALTRALDQSRHVRRDE